MRNRVIFSLFVLFIFVFWLASVRDSFLTLHSMEDDSKQFLKEWCGSFSYSCCHIYLELS